jgi:hypothetical protein
MAPKKDKRSASLLKYLSNQSDVVNARQALGNYAQTYKGIELQFKNTPVSSKNFSTIVAEYRAAETRIDALQKQLDDAEKAATLRFKEQQTEKTETKRVQETFDIETQLNPLYIERNQRYVKQRLPVPETLNSQITELETKLREKGGRPTPGVEITDADTDTDTDTGTGDTPPPESALTEDRIAFAQKYIGNVEKTKELQQALKDAGVYKGPVDGIFRAGPIDEALDKADTEIGKYESYGITFPDRIEALKRIATDFKSGGGVGGASGISLTISNPTQADAYVNAAFNSELGRDATAAELQKYRKILNTAEEKNPTKTVNGRTVGGINRDQFLKGEIAKLPEFSKKKTDKAGLTAQSILTTAKANGITLGPDQINSFTKQVIDGTDINVIQNQIRSIAANGMPDNVKKLLNEGIDLETVYAPYKNLMASTLELNPESIDLKDPTLRLAFGPDKETTIYDFEKALRKDYRWQYTDNAKRDVSNVALKVLQDFGFQA